MARRETQRPASNRTKPTSAAGVAGRAVGTVAREAANAVQKYEMLVTNPVGAGMDMVNSAVRGSKGPNQTSFEKPKLRYATKSQRGMMANGLVRKDPMGSGY